MYFVFYQNVFVKREWGGEAHYVRMGTDVRRLGFKRTLMSVWKGDGKLPKPGGGIS